MSATIHWCLSLGHTQIADVPAPVPCRTCLGKPYMKCLSCFKAAHIAVDCGYPHQLCCRSNGNALAILGTFCLYSLRWSGKRAHQTLMSFFFKLYLKLVKAVIKSHVTRHAVPQLTLVL